MGLAVRYSPDQPRDEDGKWSDGGGGGDLTSQFEKLSNSIIDQTAKFGTHTDDRKGVVDYAGKNTSFELNRILRGQSETNDFYSRLASDLESDIKLAPRFPMYAETYRYVREDFAKSLKVGDEFVDPAFVSTSLDRSVLSKHLNESIFSHPGRILIVRLSRGAEALAVKGSTEREIIIQRGTRFRVVRANKKNITIEAVS